MNSGTVARDRNISQIRLRNLFLSYLFAATVLAQCFDLVSRLDDLRNEFARKYNND